MGSEDRAQELRENIAEMVEHFVPAADARRVMDDVDELIRMVRNRGWDGREFS